MGARLSLNNHKHSSGEFSDTSQSVAHKRQRTFWDESPRLIPSLPDEISIQILARLPRFCHFNVKLVSRGWRSALMSEELYKVRKELGKTEEWLCILTKLDGESILWRALDPVNHVWQRLPLMPSIAPGSELRRGLSGLRLWHMVGTSIIADTLRSWIRRKDALDNIPYCGCAIGAVNGCLYVVGGLCRAAAMMSVWRYDPIVNAWSEVAPMSVGRAYCKVCTLNSKLYVIGGVSWGHEGLTPLRSAEMFDPCSGTWTELPNMPFSKAHSLRTGFLSDFLKPIATGLTSYRGKLYVPQSLYCWPFFVDVGGEVYDPETNSWDKMPVGMGEGWPAKQAGNKLSVIVNGDLFALDPSGSVDSARIKVYDHRDDAWETIGGDVRIRDLTDAESPFLLAGFLRNLHVISKDGNHNISVMQADTQNQRDSIPSTSTSSACLGENAHAPALSGDVWKVISTKDVGSAELVSCQVLEI